MTGCCGAPAVTPPTASHPALPCVTLVSCWIPGRSSTAGDWPVPRCQVRPPSADIQAAGKPLALPTATCGPPAAAVTVISCWPLPGWAVLIPAASTAPAPVTATPDTASLLALPNARACRHLAPSGERKVRSVWPDRPASTAPSGPPFIRPGMKPAGLVRAAASVQLVPLPDRYTSAAGTPSTTAGLTSRNP